MSIKNHHPPVLWRFIDGKPGHEKQSQGLCQALARETSASIHDIPVRRGWTNLAYWMAGRCPYGQASPPPDLLVGAGHATHLPMLAARRHHGGRIVVLMRPSLPWALFDLCLVPEHDSPPQRDNVLATRGVLNPLTNRGSHQTGQGLILIGGHSPHYTWSSADVTHQVSALVQGRPEMTWRLTTSRRTPVDFMETLGTGRIECFPAASTPPGWLEAQLARAGEVWVTPDSVSMVYEALSAGCRVGLFDLPATRGSRVAKSILELQKQGVVSALKEGALPATPSTAAPPLDEARRCARIILERWFS